ncbi:MAG: helix-hairpin-helix domain-containing protein [Gloeobacterales cyanobacterium]
MMITKKFFPGLLLTLAMLMPLPVLAQSTPKAPEKPTTTAPVAAPTAAPTSTGTEMKKETKPKVSKKSTTAVVDINTATAAELQAVKGIGEVTAKKIIAGRPYKSADELVTKKVMTQKQYDGMKAQLKS